MWLFLSLFLWCAWTLTPADKVTTFGTAIKNGHVSTAEETVFTHTSATGGVVTEMWMTGGWTGFDRTRVRIYIDGETTASIDYDLYLGHGIGWGDDSAWQGNEWIGKNAHGGGVYNTYRIPFGSSIKVTVAQAFAASNTFWFIIRGLENLDLVVGDLQLPRDARLKLYKNNNVTITPEQLTTLVNVPQGSGLLFMVTVQAASSDLNYLEACFRAYIDGETTPQFLSSGTEDFFLSAFYYNAGKFTTSESGLTHYDTTTGHTRLSMYKMFHRDPVVWHKSFTLKWKNFEDASCPTKWTGSAQIDPASLAKKREVHVAPMTYTSYTWVYEW